MRDSCSNPLGDSALLRSLLESDSEADEDAETLGDDSFDLELFDDLDFDSEPESSDSLAIVHWWCSGMYRKQRVGGSRTTWKLWYPLFRLLIPRLVRRIERGVNRPPRDFS